MVNMQILTTGTYQYSDIDIFLLDCVTILKPVFAVLRKI